MSSKNNKERKTIFITGVTGFIGSHLAKKLSKSSNVTGLDIRSGEFSTVLGDLESLKEEHLRGVDVVVHLAAAFEGEDKDKIYRVNVGGTKKLLELAKKAGVKRFIFASTGGIFERSKKITLNSPKAMENEYARTKKIAGDMLLAQNDMDVCVMYLFFPYGPGQKEPRLVPRLINKIKRGEPVTVNDENGPELSFTYIEDVVEQISRLCLADKIESEVILAGKSAKIGEVINFIGKIVGKKPVLNRWQNGGDLAAEDTAHKITGYGAKTGIEEGLRRTIFAMK